MAETTRSASFSRATSINPSSVLIYGDSFNIIDNQTFGSGRIDFDNAGYYEVIDPETSGKLMSEYPLYRYVYSGSADEIVANYSFQPHYTPQAASGWPNKWYYDKDGSLKYYFTRLNNPVSRYKRD